MNNHWVRIEQRLAEFGCLGEMKLLPPARDEEVAELELHIGIRLPDSVRRFVTIHNGQAGFGLIYGQQLLSVAGIRREWDNWRDIDEGEMNADCAEFMRSDPEGVVKLNYYNRAWIPLTHDAGGNHIGLDFDPDTLGTRGQVIVFGGDEDTKRLIAHSFDAFLDGYMLWLEHAEWRDGQLDAEGGF